MTLNPLEFAALVVTGFTSCAEFGSYAFVHPVIRHLPPEHHVSVEKGLLRTFGRVMPVLMTLCVVLSLAYAIATGCKSFIGSNSGCVRRIMSVRWIAVLPRKIV